MLISREKRTLVVGKRALEMRLGRGYDGQSEVFIAWRRMPLLLTTRFTITRLKTFIVRLESDETVNCYQ